MNDQMKKIRDTTRIEWLRQRAFDEIGREPTQQEYDVMGAAPWNAAWGAAMERAKILEEALNALIIDAIPCTESENPKQFFITAWSFDKTKSALAKFRGEA